MVKGIIYLIQPCELVGTNRFKIGCSKDTSLNRVQNGYKKGTRYLYIAECDDPLFIEKEIITQFNIKFKLIAGREYFEGDEEEIIKCFYEFIDIDYTRDYDDESILYLPYRFDIQEQNTALKGKIKYLEGLLKMKEELNDLKEKHKETKEEEEEDDEEQLTEEQGYKEDNICYDTEEEDNKGYELNKYNNELFTELLKNEREEHLETKKELNDLKEKHKETKEEEEDEDETHKLNKELSKLNQEIMNDFKEERETHIHTKKMLKKCIEKIKLYVEKYNIPASWKKFEISFNSIN